MPTSRWVWLCWSLHTCWRSTDRTQAMLVTGIKSKPVYTPLAPDLTGRYHLMLGHGVGSEPLLRVLRDLRAAAPESGARTRVLLGGNPDEQVASGEQFR